MQTIPTTLAPTAKKKLKKAIKFLGSDALLVIGFLLVGCVAKTGPDM